MGSYPSVFWLTFIFLLITKGILISIYAPFLPAFNVPIVNYAEAIIKGPQWLYDAQENSSSMPFLLWRPVGYPIVIAIFKLIGGEHWHWWLYSFQAALSLVASIMVFKLSKKIISNINLACLVFLLYGLSVPLGNDLLLLSDSLCGSLTTILLCTLGIRFLDNCKFDIQFIIFSGLNLAFCFLLRDSFLYLGILFFLGLMLIFRFANYHFIESIKKSGAFLAPLFFTVLLILGWNHMRTGTAIITTGGQTGYLFSVLKTAQYDSTVFGKETVLDQIANEGFIDYDDGDSIRITQALFHRHNISAIEMADLMKKRFIQSVWEHPKAFFQSLKDKLALRRQVPLLGHPFRQIDELDHWAELNGGPPYLQDWRKTRELFLETKDPRVLDRQTIVRLVPRFIFWGLGTGLFLIFIFGTPLLAIHQFLQDDRSRGALLVMIWGCYLGAVLIYLPVDIKARYLSPVAFIPIICSISVLDYFYQRLTKKTAALSRTAV